MQGELLGIHKAWLREIQPYGVVVTPPALVEAGVVPEANPRDPQLRLIELAGAGLNPEARTLAGEPETLAFVTELLGWPLDRIAGAPGGPPLELAWSITLPELRGERLGPTWMLFEPPEAPDSLRKPLLAVQLLASGQAFDAVPKGVPAGRWNPTPEDRFERYIRESGVPAGLLVNGRTLRLVVAPRAETSGRLDFTVGDLTEVMGRPQLGALLALLNAQRFFVGPTTQRLPAILERSREFQSEVSTQLAEQVYAALWELVRGFEKAEERLAFGPLTSRLEDDDQAQEAYHGLLAVLLRLVFVLYAEERGLLSDHPVYTQHYSVAGLWERLRRDQARYDNTMEQRFGAWAQLLVLFKVLYEGCSHGDFELPERKGHLFEPSRWAFLGGVGPAAQTVVHPDIYGGAVGVPRVSDGVVLRVLDRLMVLDGDRLQYRGLDVEQIGSVYESVMGYELRRASTTSIALKPNHVVVSLAELLEGSGKDRLKILKEEADLELTGKAADAVKRANTEGELARALESRRSPHTPALIQERGLYLQPTEDRRKSGSHYTPRALTAPIVEKTLEPVLRAFGERPTPEQILSLKVCDPAMGSGAFLVQACRHLGAKLVEAWRTHDKTPAGLSGEHSAQDHAQRIIAQRCLYGVDKNPLAVDLAKLSLWLVTLAKDQPFTFVDHALRYGDSLVGLSVEQVVCLDWTVRPQVPLIRSRVVAALDKARTLRDALESLGVKGRHDDKLELMRQAEKATEQVRLVADLVVASFFAAKKAKDREATRAYWETKAPALLEPHPDIVAAEAFVDSIKAGQKPVPFFHWPIEFPEVFTGGREGFDAFVGNPPFAGKNTIIKGTPDGYLDWLKVIHPNSHGNADLVAHFFRRAYGMLPVGRCFGFIATNTVAQGDTRNSGLQPIREDGGVLFDVRRRYRWPGRAAVVVTVICAGRELRDQAAVLDGRVVEKAISAFLVPGGKDQPPAVLRANEGKAFVGSYILGMGFTFDDTNDDASPIALMHALIAKDPRNAERIFPYLGGEELNTHPRQEHHRYVINFEEMSEAEARQWPDLMAIVEAKVKPERLKLKMETRKRYWWRYGGATPALARALAGCDRVLTLSRVSAHLGIVWQPAGRTFAETCVVLAPASMSLHCALQSRIHELWARTLSSTLEDRLRYSLSDAFETYPLPTDGLYRLHDRAEQYDNARARLMETGVPGGVGLTSVYNRLHDPEDLHPAIVELRRLHDAMDRAVLDAYGWTDLNPVPVFEREFGDEGKWRFRWPEADRDVVFARLLALNAERAAEETAEAARTAPPPKPTKARKKQHEGQTALALEDT